MIPTAHPSTMADATADTDQRTAAKRLPEQKPRVGNRRVKVDDAGRRCDGGAVIPPTRYTQSQGVDIAYKVVGEGPRDIVLSMPFASHLDMLWESEWVDVILQLSRWARIITFDRRGTGLSDRQLTGITAEQRSDDLVAVMDAAGSTTAVLFGWMDAAAIALLTAARHPGRVSAVIAGEALAVGHPDADHPFGIDEKTLQQVLEAIKSGAWGKGLSAKILAPELELTPQLAAYAARAETMAATPSAAAKLFEMNAGLDLRPFLARIKVPVLLIHDAASPLVPEEGVRWLAARLPTATLKITNSSSTRGTGRPLDNVLEEVEDFLLGTRSAGGQPRQVSTLLVTDVVASTESAASIGDRGWRDLLLSHRRAVRLSLSRFEGVEIDTAGDGFLASFALPSLALRCAAEIATEAAATGVSVRAGLHTGEILLQPPGIVGIAIHIAARVAALAGPSEVFFTETVRSLVMGSGLSYEAVGEHRLKGVPGEWRLYRLVVTRRYATDS
jgi:class 3 adenylate cyclase/pimeloyl-ACP methyl ester carboxylesterase